MSRQDLRDEFKETEGSPQIRGRIRNLQRQMRRRRVKADVAKAAVVLTNPTHYAVALGFDFVTMEAPKVMAKGRNLLAEEIKAEARWAGVPIVENPPLARSLYRSVEVGQAIPVELYAAVAAILAYLYRQRVEAELRERRTRDAAARAQAQGWRNPRLRMALEPGEDRNEPLGAQVLEESIDEYNCTACRSTCGADLIWHRLRDYLLPLAAISVIFVMLVPVPAAGLDFLLALSMAASIIVFLSAVQIRRAVELSVFPTLLLLLTLFRLSLNIASSRRILLHGQEGTPAAGKVIEAFGQFVVGGNYVVGFVLFLALVAIQFLVVSHGAVRTAEVTARFTLDALPGKQMAIDADMNAGLIDEAEARRRRQAIAREAEFYGAMDGAARFNQRDSLATILITAINIVAGLLIGTLQQGVELARGGAHLYRAHGRRRAGHDHSFAAGLGGRRHHAHPRQLGRHAGRRDPAATAGAAGHALHGQRGVGRHVPDSGFAEDCVSGRGRRALCGREAGCCGRLRRPCRGVDRGREEEGGRRAGLRSGGTAAPGGSDPRDRLPADSAGG